MHIFFKEKTNKQVNEDLSVCFWLSVYLWLAFYTFMTHVTHYDSDSVYVVLTTTLQFSNPLWPYGSINIHCVSLFRFFSFDLIVCCNSLNQRNNKGSYRDVTIFLFILGHLRILLFVGIDLLFVPNLTRS